MEVKTKKKHRLRTAAAVLLAMLLAAYIVLVNLLVSAALVPSFMEKLDAFQEVTEQSYAQQVHTTDVQENRKSALSETKLWLSEVAGRTEKRELISEDGYRLVATEFRAETETHRWVVALHGYTGWKEEMYPYAMLYDKAGYNALAPDLRCQGESDGDFIGMGYTDRQDVLGWIGLILEEDPAAEIVLHGQSMGAACALMTAGMDTLPDNVKCVVSDCAYTDAYDMFGRQLKEWAGLPAFPLVDSCNLALQARGGYDLKKASALEAVKRSRVPVLIIHGDEDKMVPVEMAYALYDAAACEKELYIVEGAGHAQAPDKDPEGYQAAALGFAARYVSREAGESAAPPARQTGR